MEWESGLSRWKLQYIEWIQQGPTVNIAQGTIVNILWQTIMEKNVKKEEGAYMYSWITLLYSSDKQQLELDMEQQTGSK